MGLSIALAYFLDRGAVEYSKTGRFRVNFDKIQDAVANLTRDILVIQGDGDKLKAKTRLGSPYRTSSNRTEPYRAFASRIASPLGIFEREPNRIGVPMLALDNVRFE